MKTKISKIVKVREENGTNVYKITFVTESPSGIMHRSQALGEYTDKEIMHDFNLTAKEVAMLIQVD